MTRPKPRRGKCPWCSRRHALTRAGRLWHHEDGKGNPCPGSGQVPS